MDRNAYEQYLARLTETGSVEDIEGALKDMLWSGLALHAGMDCQSEFWPRFTETIGHVALWAHDRHPSLSVEDRLMPTTAEGAAPESFLPQMEEQERNSIYNWLMAAYQEFEGLLLESQGLVLETRERTEAG